MAWYIVDNPEILEVRKGGHEAEGGNSTTGRGNGVHKDIERRNWWPQVACGSVVGCNLPDGAHEKGWWGDGECVEGLLCHLKEFALDPIVSRGLQDSSKGTSTRASYFSLPKLLLLTSEYFVFAL